MMGTAERGPSSLGDSFEVYPYLSHLSVAGKAVLPAVVDEAVLLAVLPAVEGKTVLLTAAGKAVLPAVVDEAVLPAVEG